MIVSVPLSQSADNLHHNHDKDEEKDKEKQNLESAEGKAHPIRSLLYKFVQSIAVLFLMKYLKMTRSC